MSERLTGKDYSHLRIAFEELEKAIAIDATDEDINRALRELDEAIHWRDHHNDPPPSAGGPPAGTWETDSKVQECRQELHALACRIGMEHPATVTTEMHNAALSRLCNAVATACGAAPSEGPK